MDGSAAWCHYCGRRHPFGASECEANPRPPATAASVSGNPNPLPDEAIVGKSQHGSAARSLHPQELPDVNLGRSDDHVRDFGGSCACGRDHSNKFEGGAEDRAVARANEKPAPALDAARVCECKGWRGFWRTLLWGVPHVFCDRCKREVVQ